MKVVTSFKSKTKYTVVPKKGGGYLVSMKPMASDWSKSMTVGGDFMTVAQAVGFIDRYDDAIIALQKEAA